MRASPYELVRFPSRNSSVLFRAMFMRSSRHVKTPARKTKRAPHTSPTKQPTSPSLSLARTRLDFHRRQETKKLHAGPGDKTKEACPLPAIERARERRGCKRKRRKKKRKKPPFLSAAKAYDEDVGRFFFVLSWVEGRRKVLLAFLFETDRPNSFPSRERDATPKHRQVFLWLSYHLQPTPVYA